MKREIKKIKHFDSRKCYLDVHETHVKTSLVSLQLFFSKKEVLKNLTKLLLLHSHSQVCPTLKNMDK